MSHERIVYNGVEMSRDWPAKIEAAQLITEAKIGGKQCGRIRYGDERRDWGADRSPCHDCGVVKGQFHVPGCDVERCPLCEGQALTCDCSYDEDR